MIDLNQPLDLNNPNADKLLGSIQGNIVKGHGRGHTAHLILRMTGSTEEVRKAISGYTERWVTSASDAQKDAAAWRSERKSTTFGMFLLSSDGYRYLGFDESEIPQPQDPHLREDDKDYFYYGLKRQSEAPRSFNDPPVSEWEAPYQGAIHAMALLADNDKGKIDKVVDQVSAQLGHAFEILTVERGKKQTFDFPRGKLVIEHFGFQDGVSQPIMIQQDVETEVEARGNEHWDPSAPLHMALVAEPGEGTGYGSFMVFRKLEQNVKAFWETLEEASATHGIDLELAGAMAVGRHRDGTPLIPTSVVEPNADPNDFEFGQDPDGAKCPFHAHIRKTNPRGDIERNIPNGSTEFERARRIVRRGITYGDRPDLEGDSDAELPESGVGLLFMCFQGNLDQFAIQQEGADGNEFVKLTDPPGPDAVIGQSGSPVEQRWPSTSDTKFTMANFVKMLGGEYFFAPSLPFLQKLASPVVD